VLDHNPELRSVQQSSVTAQAAVVSAGALPNPKLEWSRGDNKARMASAMPGNVQTMGISVPIEMPSVRNARIDAAQAGQRASVQQIAASRNALVAQVKLKAYEVVLRQAQAQAAYDAVKLLEQAHERVRVRVSSGEAARYEIIKADAELINARQQEQSARLQVEQSKLTLNRLAAGQLPARFDLALSLQDPVNKSLNQGVDAQTHPELMQLRSEVEKAEANKQGAKASRWPGVELRYAQTREPDIRNNTIGVTMQIPLFDQRRGPMEEAASEAERARLRLEGRTAELEQQMLQASKVLEMAQVRAKALGEGSVKEAEAALRVAEAAYRYGERGILDVLDAQRVLRTVRADLLEARYQMQSARIELDFLAGRYADFSAL
jgi:cobalt-zinc-cadmium efflux system outer membrane protein